MRRRVALVLTVMALALLLASGAAWAVTKVGTNGPDTLRGTNGSDTLIGRGGSDLMLAFGGFDTLAGGPGNDEMLGGSHTRPFGGSKVMTGGPGDDFLGGGLGVDTLAGQGGADLLVDGPPREFSQDTLSGGTGNDTFVVDNRPAARDIVSCGPGFDVVEAADSKDIVGRDCERVNRL
jgi:Ca2+-binding RTX toxin-like protein